MAEDTGKKELLFQATDAEGEKQLADQIRIEISKKGEQLSKFLALVSSFEDDIPNEVKRYAAAIKAMSAAAGLKKEDLLAAADLQLEALKEQQTEITSSLADRRTELKIKEQKARDVRKQIDLLTESIKRLEGEEKDLVVVVASGETELRTIESKLGDIIRGIEKEVLDIKDKINEKFEKAQTAAAPVPVTKEAEEKAAAAISSMIEETQKSGVETAKKKPVPKEPKEVEEEEFEEEEEEEERPKRKRDYDEEEDSGLLKSPIELMEEKDQAEKQGAKTKEKKKNCPVCSNPMDWYSVDKNWKCFVCGHEEKG